MLNNKALKTAEKFVVTRTVELILISEKSTFSV